MSKSIQRLLTVALAVAAMLTLGVMSVSAGPPVTNLNTTVTYPTIQLAIDDASPGDVISVPAGTYSEALNVNKSVGIVGAGRDLTTVVAAGLAGYNSSGIYVSADNVTVQGLTLVGQPGVAMPRYGLKVHAVSGATLQDLRVMDVYRSGFDLLGSMAATVTDVESINNGGHGMALTDCNGVVVTDLTATGNGWSPVSVATWGNYTPLGTSGIVFQGTNTFDGVFQLEQGRYSGGPPEPISYSTDIGDGADVTVQASDFAWAMSGDDDEAPAYQRVFLFQTWADVVAAAEVAPLGHLTGNYYAHNMVDQTQYHVTSDTNCSIQAAVDAAGSGDTVIVASGTYVEQVVIDKDLTVAGEGDTSVIQSPDVLVAYYTTSKDNYPIVYAKNATVTLDSLKVDGAGKGNANYRMNGVAFVNADGTIQNCSLVDVRDTPFSGAQHGVALYAWGDDAQPHTLNVWDNVFTGFQKNAMALNADDYTPLVVDVRRNTVTGAGATDVTAQNGIQVWGLLASGVVDDNTVTGIGYSGASWVASSVLNYYADLTILNNTVSGAQVGVYMSDGSGTIQDNGLTVEMIGDACYGVMATDPPEALPSPFGDPELMGTTLEGVSLKGTTLAAVDSVLVKDNTITFSGVDNTNSVGVQAVAGWGDNDVDLDVNNNVIDGFEVGVYTYQDTSSPGVYTSIKVNHNDLSTNDYGVYSNVDCLTADAEYNWWGEASGPGPVGPGSGAAVSEYVDYSPWYGDAAASFTVGSNVSGEIEIPASMTTAQANAIISSAPEGAVILLLAGEHQGGLNLTTPGITIIGEPGAIIGAGSPAFTVTAANVTIKDLVIDGNAGSGTGASFAAIYVGDGGDNLTIENCEIKNWRVGVDLYTSSSSVPLTSFKMVGNWVHDNQYGLRRASQVVLDGVVTIEGNLIKDNSGFAVVQGGIRQIDVSYNSFGVLGDPATAGLFSGGVVCNPWTYAEVFMDMAPDTEATAVSVDEGDTFDVALKVDAKALMGLTFKVTYDTDWLTLNSRTWAAPFAGHEEDLDATPVDGQENFRVTLMTPVDGDGMTVLTLNFTAQDNAGALGAGPWTELFDISHIEAETSAGAVGGVKIFVDNAGYGTTSRDIADADDGQVVITGLANYAGFVDLQGRANDAGATVSVTQTLTLKASATSSSSGAYTTAHESGQTLVVGQTYDIAIDAPLFLAASASGIILNDRPLNTLALCKLLGGDATDDESIDISDIAVIGGQYGLPAAPGDNADVNIDGQVDILDLVLAAGNYGLSASPWTP